MTVASHDPLEKSLTREEAEEADQLAAAPERWDTLPDEALARLLHMQCLHYGFTADEARIPPLANLYRYATNRLSRDDRLALLEEVTAIVEQYPNAFNALDPFAYQDNDFTVQSTALLNEAILTPLMEGDPMTGPKYLLGVAIQGTDQAVRVATVSALLLLGDKRVMEVIDGAWNLLDPEGRTKLAHATSGFLTAGRSSSCFAGSNRSMTSAMKASSGPSPAHSLGCPTMRWTVKSATSCGRSRSTTPMLARRFGSCRNGRSRSSGR